MPTRNSNHTMSIIEITINTFKPLKSSISIFKIGSYRHPRVQVSPKIMMVAVAVPVSPPVQHSPIFGHFASSHTVWRLRSLSFALIAVYFSPPGITLFIQCGFGIGFFFVPTSTEYTSSSSSSRATALLELRNSFRFGSSFANLWRRDDNNEDEEDGLLFFLLL